MSTSDDTYLSIRKHSLAEIKIKGSRFIGEALPAMSAEQAESEIETIRKREYGATHHCTAYRIGKDGAVFRYDDDGEPGGTAGMPILRQIDARRLTNTLVVVTRYFGGTKLGTGGLLRAYAEAAGMALDSGESVRHVISDRVNVSFDYDDTSPAMLTIDRFAGRVVDATYSDRTDLTVSIRRSLTREFIDAFVNALGGRGIIAVAESEDQRPDGL